MYKGLSGRCEMGVGRPCSVPTGWCPGNDSSPDGGTSAGVRGDDSGCGVASPSDGSPWFPPATRRLPRVRAHERGYPRTVTNGFPVGKVRRSPSQSHPRLMTLPNVLMAIPSRSVPDGDRDLFDTCPFCACHLPAIDLEGDTIAVIPPQQMVERRIEERREVSPQGLLVVLIVAVDRRLRVRRLERLIQ